MQTKEIDKTILFDDKIKVKLTTTKFSSKCKKYNLTAFKPCFKSSFKEMKPQ